jgi:hypothetical protein
MEPAVPIREVHANLPASVSILFITNLQFFTATQQMYVT